MAIADKNEMIIKNDKIRKKYIDIARGIAIILMVVGHVTENVKSVEVLWFIPFLILIRIIFYLLKKATKNNDKLLTIYCILISYIIYLEQKKNGYLLVQMYL